MDLQVKMNTPEHNFDVKSKSTQPLDSRQHMSTNQKDCQGKVNDFFESLMMWRDESQKQFVNVVNTHSKIINEAISNLVGEASDLQAQLSVCRKERNELIETVRYMSGNIKKQFQDENAQDLDGGVMEHLENEETCLDRISIGNEDHNPDDPDEVFEHIDNISDEPLDQHKQMLHDGVTESDLTSNVNPTYQMKEYVGTGPVNTDVHTNVVLKQKKSPETNEEKKFKCEECPYASSQKYSLKNHIDSKHIKVKKHACKECIFKTTCMSSLYKHRQLHKFTNTKLQCSHCLRTFVREDNLKKHIHKMH